MRRRQLIIPFIVPILVVLVGVLGFKACNDAKGAPGPVSLAIFAQAGDSVGLTLTWSPAPQGRNQRPIVGYDTRLIGTQANDTLVVGTAPASPDTLWTAAPPAGDTLFVRGCVRTVDDRAGRSLWRCSVDHAFEMPYLPPSPPDSVTTDTLPPIQLTALHVRPQNVVMTMGDSVQFCAIGEFSDGTHGILGYADLGPWAQSECDTQYLLWQTERSASREQGRLASYWATQRALAVLLWNERAKDVGADRQ